MERYIKEAFDTIVQPIRVSRQWVRRGFKKYFRRLGSEFIHQCNEIQTAGRFGRPALKAEESGRFHFDAVPIDFMDQDEWGVPN